jgi:hypothetical protein
MADNTATNDITNDRIVTKRSTTYADNYGNVDFSDMPKPDYKVTVKGKAEHLNELLKDPIDGFNDKD